MGETITRTSEVRSREIERPLLTVQEREDMAWKEGSEIYFLTHTKKACHLPRSHCYLKFRLNVECF